MISTIERQLLSRFIIQFGLWPYTLEAVIRVGGAVAAYTGRYHACIGVTKPDVMGVQVAVTGIGLAVIERAVDAACRHRVQQVAGSEQRAYIYNAKRA